MSIFFQPLFCNKYNDFFVVVDIVKFYKLYMFMSCVIFNQNFDKYIINNFKLTLFNIATKEINVSENDDKLKC